MSHRKAIESGKERRKPWRGAKDWDHRCRNHGDCSWCEGNRTHRHRRRDAGQIDDWKGETETDETGDRHA